MCDLSSNEFCEYISDGAGTDAISFKSADKSFAESFRFDFINLH